MAVSATTPNAFPNLPVFSSPVGLLQAPGDDSRWFAIEQAGRVRTFANQSNVGAATDFIDIRGRVAAGGELGLLGMAFDPNFATNRRVFLSYTTGASPRVSRVSRFTSADNGATLDPNSELVLLTVNQPEDNHNGGNIVFGPDGYLYLGLGDGGGGGDNHGSIGNGQRLSTLLGKILRIDVGATTPYAIPISNPFASNPRCPADGSGTQNCPEIFAWGFRNPWRFSFDRDTGDLWVADVGQSMWEEVDRVELAGNYGWRCREGAHDYNTANCNGGGFIDPVAEYDHSLGVSITGGYVYRGTRFAPLQSRYIFGDFGSGRIWAWIAEQVTQPRQPTLLADTNLAISSFGEANDGELYVVNYGGTIHRLEFAGGASVDNTPATLSATGCVDASDATQAAAGLIPYAINAPFWSDGASKDRWIALPDGQNSAVDADGDWLFPIGSVLMKNFRVDGALVETRLLLRHLDGAWAGYTYEWNSTQTDATRVQGGAIHTLANGQRWIFPSEAQCLQCHTGAAGFSLGLETAQLNRDFTYTSTGRTANQLFTHSSINTVSPPYPVDVRSQSAFPNPTDSSAPIASRARAYLHVNCSQCHRPGGPTPSNMDLRYTAPLAQMNVCNVAPTAGNLGIGGAQLLAPGNSAQSVLPARMSRRDANAMPPLGSNLIDAGGVTLVSQWIDSLSGC